MTDQEAQPAKFLCRSGEPHPVTVAEHCLRWIAGFVARRNKATQELGLTILKIDARDEMRSYCAFRATRMGNTVGGDHHRLLTASRALFSIVISRLQVYGYVRGVAKQAVQKCPGWARQIVRSYYVQPQAVLLYWPGSKTHF